MPSSSSSSSSQPSDQVAASSCVDNDIDNEDGDTTTTSTANTTTGSSSSSSSTSTMINVISKDELIELIKAVKFANPTYSQRDVYKEIVIAIPTKFPAYASSLNESTIVLNDVKKVWKKATSATSAAKKKTTNTTTSVNTNNDDDLAERLRQMDTNPEVFTIGVPTTTTNNSSTSQSSSSLQSQSSSSATAVAKEYLTQHIQEQAMLTEEKKRILLDEYVHVFLDIPADSNIGSKPHQALINFQNTNNQNNSNSNSSNKKGKNKKKKGRKGGNNSSTSSSTIQQQSSSLSSSLPLVALPFEDAIIVKIQMAAPLSNDTMTATKHPMLLYDKERKYKTFIHPNCALTSKTSQTTSIGNNDNANTTTTTNDDNDNDDGYSRIAYWIDKSGIDGVLGSTGGTKAYFYGRLTPTSTLTTTPNHNRRILSIYVKELASSQQDW